jgi:hypothetical protein
MRDPSPHPVPVRMECPTVVAQVGDAIALAALAVLAAREAGFLQGRLT